MGGKWGGARKGSGPKAKPKAAPVGDKNAAGRILDAVFGPKPHLGEECKCELCWWWELIWAADMDLRERTGNKLYDKRDGKAVQTVNHLHDKPIEMNLTISRAEEIRKARQRAAKK